MRRIKPRTPHIFELASPGAGRKIARMQRSTARGESTIGWLFRGGKLWFLTAILAALTLYSMVTPIHDSYTQRTAIGMIAGDVARDVSNAASNRAERLVLETFAPVIAAAGSESADRKTTLQAIADALRRASDCACRDTLPASGLFYLRPPASAQSARALDGRSIPAWSILEPIVSRDMERARSARRPVTHVTVSKALGADAVLTMVDVDPHGTPIVAFGFHEPTITLVAT